jgi:hypothetical protein
VGTDADDMFEMVKSTRYITGRADQSGTTAIPTAKITAIGTTLDEIFARAAKSEITTEAAAHQLARERMSNNI